MRFGIIFSVILAFTSLSCKPIVSRNSDSANFSEDTNLFDTSEKYSKNGVYTAERLKVHKEIVDIILERGVSEATPKLIFTAGAPGAGKSTTLGSLKSMGLIQDTKYMTIDADEIKTMLPEYKRFSSMNPEAAAEFVHTESSLVRWKVYLQAVKLRKNIILEGSMYNPDQYLEIIKNLKAESLPYKTFIVFVDASLDILLKRVEHRFKETGRNVPKESVIDSKNHVPASVRIVRDYTDGQIEINNDSDVILKECKVNGVVYNMNVKLDAAVIGSTEASTCFGPIL